MPMVIKRDQTGKDPKAKKADPAATKPAASAKPAKPAKTPNPAGAGTSKPKTGGAESSEKTKLIALGAITILALGFLVWYFFLSGPPPDTGTLPSTTAQGTGTPGGGTPPGARAGGITTTDGIPNLGKSLGGSEGGTTASGREDDSKGQGEGIP